MLELFSLTNKYCVVTYLLGLGPPGHDTEINLVMYLLASNIQCSSDTF